MTTHRTLLTLAVGIALGALLQPRVNLAQAAETEPQRALWSYKCVAPYKGMNMNGSGFKEEILVEMGEKGWELAGVQGDVNWARYCFKRPLDPKKLAERKAREAADQSDDDEDEPKRKPSRR